MLILSDADQNFSGMLRTKAEMLSFKVDWNSYLGLLSQSAGIGGILLFGFVASWIFGREYSDNTAKDMMALPVSRAKIVNAKFIVYFFWCLALTISNLLIGMIIASLLNLPGFSIEMFSDNLSVYIVTAILCIAADVPIAFFACTGKGYMAPLGFVVLTLVFSQIIASLGFGAYFPWAIPGIFSGAAGSEINLDLLSYILLLTFSFLGYLGTVLFWRYADHAK